ncbi:MAG TPA: glycosyltransferase [Pyrinomonadaceae bacterium]
MRVLHILDSLNRGGAETLALDLCRNARAGGLELTFVATGGGDLEDDFRRSGADFIRLRRELPVDLNLAASLREIVRERNVEVVHCHQAVEALHAYLATRGTGVKRVLSFHLCSADAKNRLALKLLAPRMDANVAVSRDLLACLGREAGFDTGRNFHVVYNGVDARRLTATAGAHDLRGEPGLGAEDMLFGMVGNFYADDRKDQLTVCRALPRLFDAVPRSRFVFVGATPAGSPTRAYDECVDFCRRAGLEGRVRFLGKRDDIPAVLAALDVFVLSSRADTFGVAAVEAMMAGVPAVLSDIGPLREVSNEGEYAALFRTGDAEDLARVLIELANHAEGRTRLASRAREWATQQFSIESHIAGLIQLYGRLGGV